MKHTRIISLIVLFLLLGAATGCAGRCEKVEAFAARAEVAYGKIVLFVEAAEAGRDAACIVVNPDGVKCAKAKEWLEKVIKKAAVGKEVFDLAIVGVALLCPSDGIRFDARAAEEFDLDRLEAMILDLEAFAR